MLAQDGHHPSLNLYDSLEDSKERDLFNGVKKPHRSKDKTAGAVRLQPESSQPVDAVQTNTSDKHELQIQFREYEQSKVHVEHVLQYWDRRRGLLLLPLPNAAPAVLEPRAEKQSAVDKKSRKGGSSKMPVASQTAAQAEAEKELLKVSPEDLIPHFVLNVTETDCSNAKELLKDIALPPLDDVLDDLGVGPSGPPIPPATILSVVPFPKVRQPTNSELICDCFNFLAPPGSDIEGEEKRDSEEDAQLSDAKEEPLRALSKLSSRSSIKEAPITKDKIKSRDSQRRKSQTSFRMKTKASDLDQHQRILELKRNQSLRSFRWVVPANGEVVLKIWFYSDSPGTFKQTFSFELLGTQRLYQITCMGFCTYPSICTEYMTLFAHSKKILQMEGGLQKAYLVKPGYFEFGPLVHTKNREKHKESRYLENTERLVIYNNSPLEAWIQFSVQHDTQLSTFMVEPTTMTLKPDERKELTVWAWPAKIGQVKESLVCCIENNPESVIINLSCWGVLPSLELDKKYLQFDRVLLNRRESSSITLYNKTTLPVSWRLQGLEELGDEFSVPQDRGIISPNTSFNLRLHFMAKRAVSVRKNIQLEVSDVEKILGTGHSEQIQVIAEAYDLGLSISPDVHLDFGTMRVFEKTKLTRRIKNLGKFEINFKFTFEQTDPAQPNLASTFTVSPDQGTLLPHERPIIVDIVCLPKTEVSMKGQPILSCQMIEPIHQRDETVANLVLRVSVQAVFSRYKISPVCDINFGPLIYGIHKIQSFTIKNTGIFETHFSISCTISDSTQRDSLTEMIVQEKDVGRGSVARKGSGDSLEKYVSNVTNYITSGIFTVSPCTGDLPPGSQEVVTVKCAAEQLGTWNEVLYIELSDRDPYDHPGGIPYRLLAEVYKPGIVLDMASIFEEHHLCQRSTQLCSAQFANAKGIYVLEENKFIFNKVLVGHSAQARFKLTNTSKVPCVLSLAIKSGGGAKTSRNIEAFELSATTLNIPTQSHSFAMITFTPQSVQPHSAAFEATTEGLEGAASVTPTFKIKVLEFDLYGEGNMPSVRVVRPGLRHSKGSPVLQFKRVIAGRRHTLPLVLLNDGNVPAQVQIDMLDKHGVFTLRAVSGNASISSTQLEDSENQLEHRGMLKLNVDEQVELAVSFCSDKPLSVKAKMTLQVDDQHCATTIQVNAESYHEIVSIDNISSSLHDADQEEEESGNYDVINFGECHVDFPYQEIFTMTNHSSSQVLRFEWHSAVPCIFFSPQIGHIHAGCSKDVTVTFRSGQAVTLNNRSMKCKVSQIEFKHPVEEVADWDDRQKALPWLSSSKRASEAKQRPSERKKASEIDPEPRCSVIDGSQLDLELRIRAVCDYVKFNCPSDSIHFQDTKLYQTRLHQLQIANQGSIKLEFSWELHGDPNSNGINSNQTGETSVTPRGSRSAGALTEVCPVSLSLPTATSSPELPPFSIEPSVGTIDSGSVQDFSVCFSPLEVGEFQGKLFCSIPNLHNGDQAPCISVCGRSLQPHCHFDLKDSDYISGNRRNNKLKDLLDMDIRVIEFNTVGLSAPSKRSFLVLNTTSQAYSYKWKCEDTGTSPFRCLTPCGTIQPGEKVEMCFEYIAEQLDVVESFWSFVVETLSLTLSFLCVGITREPLVYLSTPHLDFGELLVGHKVEQTVNLVNGEEDPVHFSVLRSSLLCEDQHSVLNVHPMSGTVPPKDSLPLSVLFTPCQEGYVSFRMVVKVKRRTDLLILNVKAECFTMNTLVQVERADGRLRQINPNHPDILDFGKVGILQQSSSNFLISNLARFRLEVSFDLSGPRELLKYLEAKPKNGTVEIGNQLRSSLHFCPRGNCSLHGVLLSIRVKHGPTFTLAVKGKAVLTSLEFSFTKFNFDKCFLSCPGMKKPPSQTLVISNKGELDISIQCQFKNTSYLEIDFEPRTLPPGAVMEVPVTFHPQEARRYYEKLIFILNGCVTKQVDILGQGTELKLEVEDPKKRKLKLGSLILGQKVKRKVVLVNRSSVDLCFTLLLNANTPLETKDLSVSPAGELNLKSGASCKVDIQFSPRQHIKPFEAELQADFPSLVHPLLTIQGSCQGVLVSLDQKHLTFGPVVKLCKAKKKIVMMNTGDIGASFQWKTKSFPPELSISPDKGYISPGMKVPFDVTFAPMQQCADIRYENLSCVVENATSAVTLTVTGSCIAIPGPKEVLNFVCPVRGSHTQTLTLFNPTIERCTIRPLLKGEQWRAPPSVTFEASQHKYEITYQPLTMTARGKKHQGSVFFSFPDGSGIVYSLRGTADPPKAEDTVMCELPAKTQHTQLLPVRNWLSRQQRFSVRKEILKPDKPDATVSLEGLKFIDVPALAKRDYKMSFFTYKEGQYNAKVTFYDEVTGEYLFFIVTYKVTSSDVLSTIELVTTVRRTISATVQVENPLTTATCLTAECKCADISAPPQYNVPGRSKGSLSFQYMPLSSGESTARLILSSSDLGSFYYNLLLRALPPPPEKTVHFTTSLGSSHTVPVQFTNYSRVKGDYTCKTDCQDFSADKVVGASPGVLTSVDVCFEPHQLGEVRGQLSLAFANADDYIFPLHGICLPPKAQGPLSIKAGRNTAIPFKNVFLQPASFSFQVDNPCFSVKGGGNIASKKVQNIQVTCDAPPGDPHGPWFGKLIICTQRLEGHSKPYSWVYYLKGFPST